MPLIIPTNSISDLGYNVDNSLRFNSASSDCLSLLYGTSGNRKTFTFSTWFKRSLLGTKQSIIRTSYTGSELFQLYFLVTTDELALFSYSGGGVTTKIHLKPTQKFRDPSAWYHVVFAIDTTQATASDRANMYINGQLVTDFSSETYPALNSEFAWISSTHTMYIGGTDYYSGYLAETITVDGLQLDATSFGEFDADSGIWKPIDVSGLTFGSKGFYLPYKNSGALGQDDSGNGNNFTVNNLTSIDQTTDTPTNNYCTLNPLNFGAGTLSEGNLKWSASGNAGYLAFGTIGIDMNVSNQFYWETKIDSIGSGVVIGIAPTTLRWNDTGRAGSYGYYSDGRKYTGTTASSYGASFTTGDTIGVLAGNGTITFYKNGSSQGTAFTGLSGTYLPFIAEISHTNSMNFGSPPYTISSGNTDPAGYGNFEYSTNGGYALNTKNLAEYG